MARSTELRPVVELRSTAGTGTYVTTENRRNAPERMTIRTTPWCAATSPGGALTGESTIARMPRDASATRLRNRDVVDGRPRGCLRPFGLSRIRFRQVAHAGELPGITESS